MHTQLHNLYICLNKINSYFGKFCIMYKDIILKQNWKNILIFVATNLYLQPPHSLVTFTSQFSNAIGFKFQFTEGKQKIYTKLNCINHIVCVSYLQEHFIFFFVKSFQRSPCATCSTENVIEQQQKKRNMKNQDKFHWCLIAPWSSLFLEQVKPQHLFQLWNSNGLEISPTHE